MAAISTAAAAVRRNRFVPRCIHSSSTALETLHNYR
jgi:hypothetical protein